MSTGRFANLEMGKPEPGSPMAAQGAARRAACPNDLRDADYYLNQGRALELAADFEAALRSYSAVLGEDPTRLEGWLGQLWVLYELEEFPEVDLWARKASEQFPENPALLAMRSLAAHGHGRRREGRGFNDAALAGKGAVDVVWLARADLMLDGTGPVGEECLGHALRVSATPDLTRLRGARICFRRKRYRLALQELLEVTAHRPEAAGAWHLLGLVHDALGDGVRAAEALRQAVELAPRNAEFRADLDRLSRRGKGVAALFRRMLSR